MALECWALATLWSIEQRSPPIFSRAAITLGIGPHSSSNWFLLNTNVDLVVNCTNLMQLLRACQPMYNHTYGTDVIFSDNVRTVCVHQHAVHWPYFVGIARISRWRCAPLSFLPPLPFFPSHFIDVYCCWLSDGWYQKILPQPQFHFYICIPYAYIIFLITYVQYTYFVLEGDVWSFLFANNVLQ